jgi:hypothetical protein
MRLAKSSRTLLPLALSAVLAASVFAQDHPNVQPNAVRDQLMKQTPGNPQPQSAPPPQAPAVAKGIRKTTSKFGARLELYAAAWKFNAYGFLSFDVLFQFNPFYFVADVTAMLALRVGSSSIASIKLTLHKEFSDGKVNVLIQMGLRKEPDLLARAVAAIIKAHRFMYREKERTLDIASKHTGYPKEVLGPAYDALAAAKVWPVNDGMPSEMVDVTINKLVEIGLLKENEKPKVEQIVDRGPANSALAKLGRWTDSPNWK